MYDYDASLLKSDAKKKDRALRLFHDCCSIVSADLLEFCEQRHTMRCGDGHDYVVVPRLAFVAADFQQIHQNLALVGGGCHVCECPKESLDCTDTLWPLRDSRKALEAMYLLADEVLNEDGSIKFRMKKRISEWEKLWGVKFLENGFAPLSKVGFDAHVCNPRDLLHHITLGLYGEHIVNSSVHTLIFDEAGLGNQAFWAISKSQSQDDSDLPAAADPAPISDAKVKGIWDRLALRLANIREEDAGFTISSKMSKHFLKVYNTGSSSFTGHRMHLVMLAFPFVLRGLISSVIEDISSRIASSVPGDRLYGQNLPLDPTDSILEVHHVFMEWFLTIRMPDIALDCVVESQRMAEELIECLKRVFPDRGGKELCWKLGKCHDVLHVAGNIALFGWTHNTSGDWGEHGHQELLKCLAGLINNKDIFLQFARWHEKAGLLQRESDLHSDSESNSESEPDLDSEPVATGKTRKNHDNPSCELAVKYPLLHAAIHFKDLKYSKGSAGKHGTGRYTLEVWSLPADRVPQLPLVKEHPILTALPTALGVFAFDFLQTQMGLMQKEEPTVAQVNEVLVSGLTDPMLRTFACLSLKLPGCQGVQRIRSFPFGPKDRFHGRNHRPTVFVIPPKRFSGRAYRCFDFKGPDDLHKLWVGRLELLFTCCFRFNNQNIPCDLALVSFLYPFKVPEAMGPLQQLSGCNMYYDPAPRHWIRAVPVQHIIGRLSLPLRRPRCTLTVTVTKINILPDRAPLMKCYLDSGDTGTIPSHLAKYRAKYFKHGSADRGSRLGSKLYELNMFAWKFGRPISE